jgi:thioesterase domain-containing protein
MANTRAFRRSAARRKFACWPSGRSEMTYHPANGEAAEPSFGMPKASHTPPDLTTNMNAALTSTAEFPPAASGLDALNVSFNNMPPVAAMQIRAVSCDGERLYLHAPLTANVNDKNCAFGGSLASVMTLSAWGLLTWRLAQEGITAEVYVADSQLRYLAPLQEDLLGEGRFGDDEDWGSFLRCFQDRGRARIGLNACVRDSQGRVVAEMSARFAALRSGS